MRLGSRFSDADVGDSNGGTGLYNVGLYVPIVTDSDIPGCAVARACANPELLPGSDLRGPRGPGLQAFHYKRGPPPDQLFIFYFSLMIDGYETTA